MYSRNYVGYIPENGGAANISESLRREGLRKERERVPVKSFPEAGALAHFEREYGKRRENEPVRKDLEPVPEQTAKELFADEAANTPALPVNAEPNLINPEKAKTVTLSASNAKQVHEPKSEGLALKLKKSISKYTDGIFGIFSFDDFLLIALLLLFLTDDNEENDSLIPIILLALILL